MKFYKIHLYLYVYYNPFVKINEFQIKYGVIEVW